MIYSSLARRGFEATVGDGKQEMKLNIPAWGILLLSLTTLGYLFVVFMIEYTFGRLIPALIIVESPQDLTFEALPQDDPDSINKTPEPASAKAVPITSSFRKTIRHLHSIGGFRARFRGLSVFLVASILIEWIANMISSLPLLNNLFGQALATFIAFVALAQFSLLWTTIVISEPSPKAWFRRFPSIKLWKKVAAPTALFALSQQIAIWIPMYIATACGFGADKDELANMNPHQKTVLAVGTTGAFVLSLILAVVFVIPAFVVMTRVQASLLSDAEETIVPFDRSFGGKFVPEIVGGSGVVSMRDAWNTFDWSARVRLVKAYVKVFGMQMAVSILYIVVVVAQMFIIMGKKWDVLVPKDGDL